MAKKILIVEDEKILGEMYQDKFAQSGFKVILVEDAIGGINLAKKEKPDLILLDILLSKESGIFFLEEAKKDPAINFIPVLAFSNLDDPKIRKDADRLGAKDYLIKTNYTPQEIIEKVKEHLKN